MRASTVQSGTPPAGLHAQVFPTQSTHDSITVANFRLASTYAMALSRALRFQALAGLSAVLLLCMAVNWLCGYVGVPGLVRAFLRGDSSVGLQEWGLLQCPSVAQIAAWSPRSIADPAVMIGPAPIWAAVAWHVWANDRPRQLVYLVTFMLTFVAISMPVRYLHDAVGFDPSGHTLVFGAQLLPLLIVLVTEHQLHKMRSNPVPLLVAAALAFVDAYFLVASVSFFHTPAEVLTVWAVLSAAFVGCTWGPLAAAQPNSQLVYLKAAMRRVVVVWGLATVMVLVLAAGGGMVRFRPMLMVMSLLHDGAVLACVHGLLRKFSSFVNPEVGSPTAVP